MSILYAISIVYIAGEYDGPPFCTPIGCTRTHLHCGDAGGDVDFGAGDNVGGDGLQIA